MKGPRIGAAAAVMFAGVVVFVVLAVVLVVV